jgi:hypothetical protein
LRRGECESRCVDMKLPPGMRFLIFVLLSPGFGMGCMAAAPSGVDGLTPEDVTKAIGALKEDFARPDALSDAEMGRATLQGLLDRLAPAVTLVSGTQNAPGYPYYSEICSGSTGYLRVGDLSAKNVESATATLKEWSGKGVNAVVLDLRASGPGSDFDSAAELAGLFCAKGTELFSLTAGKGHTLQGASDSTQTFSAKGEPVFKGLLIVLVDAETAEAAEGVAASLKTCAKGLLVGTRTAGRAYQYSDVTLSGGALLRVAVAQVILADGKEPGENGLTPDIEVGLGDSAKGDVMTRIAAKGVASVVDEHDRPHLTEAALVSGSNPELDELEAEQNGQKDNPVIDRQLQRALDAVTSIEVYRR